MKKNLQAHFWQEGKEILPQKISHVIRVHFKRTKNIIIYPYSLRRPELLSQAAVNEHRSITYL